MRIEDSFIKTAATLAELDGYVKLAQHEDPEIALEAQKALAYRADQEYERIYKVACAHFNPDMMSKLAQANAVAGYAVSQRNHVQPTGEKLADDCWDAVQKLNAAALVDRVLQEKIASGDDEARHLQLLGREYAMHLMGCITG